MMNVCLSAVQTRTLNARARDAMLVQRTGQLMYELSTFYPEISGLQPAYGWECDYTATATACPIIGPHRNYPFHLFALRRQPSRHGGAISQAACCCDIISTSRNRPTRSASVF